LTASEIITYIELKFIKKISAMVARLIIYKKSAGYVSLGCCFDISHSKLNYTM